MKVILSHFYNEEYLLPYWLKHHRELFDHGILIDYHSTDRSVEICRELVPGWEIVSSQYSSFSAILCDFEVMKHEERYPDAWKIVLNTTEFLVGNELGATITHCEYYNFMGFRIPAMIMVDPLTPQSELLTGPLDPERPLISQRQHGFNPKELPIDELLEQDKEWRRFMPGVRDRHMHHYVIGAYSPGRHSCFVPNLVPLEPSQLQLRWFCYSPWTEQFVDRKLQIGEQIDKFDKQVGMGYQHQDSFGEMERIRRMVTPFVREIAIP